jgi:hypothetical protein
MTRYYIRIDDLTRARGPDERFAWQGQSPQDLADAIGGALRDGSFIAGWRAVQPEPDEISTTLLEVDPDARVNIEARAQNVVMQIDTRLPHKLMAQRLTLLIGANWTLGDVK